MKDQILRKRNERSQLHLTLILIGNVSSFLGEERSLPIAYSEFRGGQAPSWSCIPGAAVHSSKA